MSAQVREKLKTKSALSWFGSDSEVAAQLAGMLNDCRHVTIPFCGGLAILPHVTAKAVVANDLHADAINFYRVLAGKFGQDAYDGLVHRCDKTLSHPDELELAKRILGGDSASVVMRAWAFWAICWLGRKGQGGTKSPGKSPSVRRKATGGTNATRLRAAAADLNLWAKEFQRCEWQSVCFRKLLADVADDVHCGVYADPPWVETGDKYQHAFSEQDHIDLAAALKRFQNTTVVVRYGDCPLIRNLYDGWKFIESQSRDQANNNKPEVWITNKA